MAKKNQNHTKRITNRRASHDYELGDSLVVGLELSGAETKSLRMGHGQLRGAYVTVKDGELFLINATISQRLRGIPISRNWPDPHAPPARQAPRNRRPGRRQTARQKPSSPSKF